MLRMRHVALLLSAAFLMNGCVALDKYNALKLERDQYLERLSQAEAEARAERAKAEMLQKQLDAILAAGGNQQDLISNLTKKNASLQSALDELNRRYADALNRPLMIDAGTNNALQALADQYPEILEWDAARGMLKFKSDVTFASGSDSLTPRAREVLGKVAKILNSPDAAKYDFLIAGHTDDVRVINRATISAGHKDNWFLSAHRAISVAGDLRNGGLAPTRMGVLGYADQHPVAPNTTAAGKAQNRRVEILILAPRAEAGATEAAPATPARRSATPALNKDSAASEAVMPVESK